MFQLERGHELHTGCVERTKSVEYSSGGVFLRNKPSNHLPGIINSRYGTDHWHLLALRLIRIPPAQSIRYSEDSLVEEECEHFPS